MFNDEIKCHYCQQPMDGECHYVIKAGVMVTAHKQCHVKSQADGSNIRIIVKGGGGGGCAGGTCRR